MKIVVTGGEGFIGRHTVHAIAQHGHEPLPFDHTRTRAPVPCFYGDIRDPTHVTEAVAHADAVIHLAGVLGTQETIRNPRPAVETNIVGGLNVLEACTQYAVPLVYIAVGNHWMDNPYSISKTTVERLCRMYRHERGLNVATVRVMNAYGPGQIPATPYGPSKVRKIIPAFMCRALTGTPIEIYGDGDQIMDMVFVTDVAETLVEAVGTNADHEVGGPDDPRTVRAIAELVIAAVGEGSLDYLPMRPGEPDHAVVVADREKQLRPATVGLEEGIAGTVDWYREHWLPGQ